MIVLLLILSWKCYKHPENVFNIIIPTDMEIGTTYVFSEWSSTHYITSFISKKKTSLINKLVLDLTEFSLPKVWTEKEIEDELFGERLKAAANGFVGIGIFQRFCDDKNRIWYLLGFMNKEEEIVLCGLLFYKKIFCRLYFVTDKEHFEGNKKEVFSAINEMINSFEYLEHRE